MACLALEHQFIPFTHSSPLLDALETRKLECVCFVKAKWAPISLLLIRMQLLL